MKKIRGTKDRPRLSVFRSNKAIYAQIIDDNQGKTLVAASEQEINKETKKPGKGRHSDPRGKQENKRTKTERAGMVGEVLAKKALKKGIKKIVLDRGRCRYHGRVKALAEGARKGGLKF